MAEFEFDVSAWCEKQKVKLDAAPDAIAEALKERVQEHTPVVTGALRADWHIEKPEDGHIVIANGKEYAHRVNSGFTGQDSLGRYYDQQGHHMVEQTLAEAPDIVERVLKDLDR